MAASAERQNCALCVRLTRILLGGVTEANRHLYSFFFFQIPETQTLRCPESKMAKRLTDNIITGHDPHLRMCYYFSPVFNMNIWRRGSSLTGERTKKDPAFKGFRQSINRMKQASPIAAALYNMVPKEIKEYALYRTLTGEAITMLKEGLEAAVISETLKTKYIEPLANTQKQKSADREVIEPVSKERVKGMSDFRSYPSAGVRKMTRRHRSFLLQKIIEGQSAVEHVSCVDGQPIPQISRNISGFSPTSPEPSQEHKRKTKTTNGLIYLGRLPECKKLKMWLRPIESSIGTQ
jgi:hypothetical protein